MEVLTNTMLGSSLRVEAPTMLIEAKQVYSACSMLAALKWTCKFQNKYSMTCPAECNRKAVVMPSNMDGSQLQFLYPLFPLLPSSITSDKTTPMPRLYLLLRRLVLAPIVWSQATLICDILLSVTICFQEMFLKCFNVLFPKHVYLPEFAPRK